VSEYLLQNTAARLVAGARRCDHISPVLAGLHWLPIRQRITFKTAVLVWKCLHDKAPRYLADLCIPVTLVEGRRQLRSATTGTLLLPRARTSTGQWSFAVFGPATWKSLPPSLYASPTFRTAILVWKCLHDKAPRYLADLCISVTSVEGRRQLRSARTGTLLLPRARTSTGQWSFAVFGPATSNSLPPSLCTPELSLSTFKRRLKTQLFQHP